MADDDKTILKGFPKDGEEAGGQDDPGDSDPPRSPTPEPTEADKKISALEAEVANLRRQVAPSEPKAPPVPPKDPVDDTDWDSLIFSKPKEAVKKIMEVTRQETIKEMTAAYNRQEGNKRFWDSFYAKNTQFDREMDHDLIELTLNKNLATLANIPVAEALTKLADLTTDRLLRYAGGTRPKGKKAVVEGSAPPAPRRPTAEPSRPGSLGDVIKNRRKARRGVAA
jgi:hypothetical protein